MKKAKERCDYLIVGVSSDELVQEYKKKSPIIPLEDRLEIVSSLRCVDEVVIQSHRDKIKQYQEIVYDIMFVGNDWLGTELFNSVESYLNKHGACIEYFEYTKRVSSTKFVSILQDLQDSEELVK